MESTAGEPVAEYVETNRDYTIPGLCKALGVEQRVIREIRAKGLPAKLVGDRRVIIRGEDFDNWLKNDAPDAPVPKGNGK